MIVRRATRYDARDISRLNADVQEVFAAAHPDVFKPADVFTMTPAAILALIERPVSLIFVAQVEDRVVGYIYAQHMHRPETSFSYAEDFVFIHHVGVAEEYRRQGIGKALVQGVMEAARKQRVERVTVDNWVFNTSAREFLQSLGFSAFSEKYWLPLPATNQTAIDAAAKSNHSGS